MISQYNKVSDLIGKRFTISAEIIPPRNGASFEDLKMKVLRLASYGPAFISVTKGAGGSLRGGSLPLAHFIQTLGIPSLAHFTCRDNTIEEVENGLIDHNYMGIHNILALRGDPPAGIAYTPRENSHSYAYALVEQIAKMNEGRYLVRKKFDDEKAESVVGEKTDFCIGVACYPEHSEGPEMAEKYMQAKIKAGAHYAITQMIFNPKSYGAFRKKFKLPILPGIHLLASKKQADFLKSHMMINIPDSIYKNVENQDWMLSHTLNLVKEFKSEGAPGIHLFIIGNTAGTYKLIEKLNNELV